MLRSMMALAKMQFKQYSIYKSNFWLFTINRLVEITVYIFVWQAIYNQTGNSGGFSIYQMITYYILVTSLRPLALWGMNQDMAHSIRSGNINKELLKPITYFQYYFGVNLGELAFGIIVGCAAFIICSLLWDIIMPVTIMNFIFFVIIILLGIPITFFFQMIIGTVGFYSSSIWGMQILRTSTISIFSGIIAPITLFPIWFQRLANILPFKDLIYTPINIWLGQMSVSEILFATVKLVIWGILLYYIAKTFFNHAVKKVTINGG